MNPSRMFVLLGVLLVTVGTGWMLTSLEIGPDIAWVWTLGLLVIGVLTFAVGGLDKVTVVAGPFFVIASCLSLLRQQNRLQVEQEIPLLVIVTGILLLVAQIKAIPFPKWIEEDSKLDSES